MPEVIFSVQLPDQSVMDCYSPSTVVRNYFATGEQMSVSEFVTRSRAALLEASERVRAKFGFACTSAAAQLAEIERKMELYSGTSNILILEI